MSWRRMRSGLLVPSASIPASAFVTTVEDSAPTASSENTYSGTAIGTAHANRQIAVLISLGFVASGPSNPTAVKLDTTSLTLGGNYATGAGTISTWYGAFATGTTADLKVTFGANADNAAMAVFEVHGMSTTIYATGGTSTSNDTDFTMNVKDAGYACCIMNDYNGSDSALGWTNATEVDEGFHDGFANYCVGEHNPTSDETPRTFTGTGAAAMRGMGGLSFQP